MEWLAVELKFKDLIAESRESAGYEPMKIDLGDGRKPIVVEDVPTKLFTQELDFGTDVGDMPRLAMDLLQRIFKAKDWDRVRAVLDEAPVRATGELLHLIFVHFGLVFSEAEAGKGSEDSDK